MDVRGKGAVITGGASGIGLATARMALVPRTLEARGLAVVEQPHLLQEHEIGVEGFDRQPEIVDLQPPRARPAAIQPVRGVRQSVLVQAAGQHSGGRNRQQGGLDGLLRCLSELAPAEPAKVVRRVEQAQQRRGLLRGLDRSRIQLGIFHPGSDATLAPGALRSLSSIRRRFANSDRLAASRSSESQSKPFSMKWTSRSP